MNYKIIAREYLLDMDYFNTLEEYVIENNLDVDMKKLNFYVKVEQNRSNKLIKENQLKDLFTNNIAIQFSDKNNSTRKAIYHLCSKENGNIYQVSFVDNAGAEMDIAADTIENIIEKFIRFYSMYNIIDEVIPC